MHQTFFPSVTGVSTFPRMPATQKTVHKTCWIQLLAPCVGGECNSDKDSKSKRASFSTRKQVRVHRMSSGCSAVRGRTAVCLLISTFLPLCSMKTGTKCFLLHSLILRELNHLTVRNWWKHILLFLESFDNIILSASTDYSYCMCHMLFCIGLTYWDL